MNNSRLPLDRILQANEDEPQAPIPAPRASERFTDDELIGFRLGVARRVGEAFRGLNNTEIARRCRTTDTAIKNYRDGRRFPSPEMLLQMWRVSGVSIHWLMTGEGPMRVRKEDQVFTPEEESRIRQLADARGISFEEMVARLATAAAGLIDNI